MLCIAKEAPDASSLPNKTFPPYPVGPMPSSARVLRPHFLFSFRKGNGVARQRKRRPRKTGTANRAAIASEEASSIPFPPGRRKLHIRWLLLPFRKPTAALGRLSVNIREPLNNRLYLVSTQCISRHLRLAEVISAQNSHYLSTFLLRFPKKGRLPLCQVVESFRPAIASAYKLAQANIAYSRFSFFLSPRYTVFL